MTVVLPNITIKRLQTKNLDLYYLIIDEDTKQTYFCFSNLVKSGWMELEQNYQTIKEVELEHETNEQGYNRVSNLMVISDSNDIVV